MIEQAQGAQRAAEAKLEAVSEIEAQHIVAKNEAEDATSRADHLHEITQYAAYAMVAKGRSVIEGDALADYAQTVFKLNGKSAEMADRQASLLGSLSSLETPVPVLLGSGVLYLLGGVSGGRLYATGYKSKGVINLGTSGSSDVFSRSEEWNGQWMWRGAATSGRVVGDVALTNQAVVSDDGEEILAAAKNDKPILAVGTTAVLSVIESGPRTKGDGSSALKYVIAKRTGDEALEASLKTGQLVKNYKDALRYGLTYDKIRENTPISVKLHPVIQALVKEENPDYSHGREISELLECDLNERGQSSILGRLYLGHEGKKPKGLVLDAIVSEVCRLTSIYNAALNPSEAAVDTAQVSRLVRSAAAYRYREVLQKGGRLTPFSREARELKQAANYIDPADIIDFMTMRSPGNLVA